MRFYSAPTQKREYNILLSWRDHYLPIYSFINVYKCYKCWIFSLLFQTVLGLSISKIHTDDPSPLVWVAIILGEMRAVEDGGLVAQALYIVHCKGRWDRAKLGLDGMLPRSISQHSEDQFVMTMILWSLHQSPHCIVWHCCLAGNLRIGIYNGEMVFNG